jgi:hypothetical protein
MYEEAANLRADGNNIRHWLYLVFIIYTYICIKIPGWKVKMQLDRIIITTCSNCKYYKICTKNNQLNVSSLYFKLFILFKTCTTSQSQSSYREGANAKLNLKISDPLTCVSFTDNPPIRASNQQLYLWTLLYDWCVVTSDKYLPSTSVVWGTALKIYICVLL